MKLETVKGSEGGPVAEDADEDVGVHAANLSEKSSTRRHRGS